MLSTSAADLDSRHQEGRLTARPRPSSGSARANAATGAATKVERGDRALGLSPGSPGREARLYVPKRYDPARPAALFVMLHGAGGRAEHGLDLVRTLADETGSLVLAPQSRGQTWDVIVDELGPDVEMLDRALEEVFASYAVDPAHVAIGGFSDGASYAVTLGISNGDLFSEVLAFSPGFAAPAALVGKPRFFVSHGVHDRVLPIERCSRRLVPRLEHAGYTVTYREFDGPHTVPADLAAEAVRAFLARPAPSARN